MSTDEVSEVKPGQVIGAYEIISFISRGGMGEVYLALHRRLNRKVALKFLPTSFMQDRDRLRRFEHEALVASALNHPNILTVHEIGKEEGRPFIVTEFVDGETLRQRMARGPLTIPEALHVTEQIASALAAAHVEGVVHRDIKPDNIMLRRDGIVKVLDLGLAKLCDTKVSGPEDETRALVITTPGLVMGTVNYMSPEQARGLPVDSRTDLWSLGVVLYEMLTGRLPFTGQTASDVIVSLLEREPRALSESRPSEMDRVQPVVSRALTKDLDNRYQRACEMLDDVHRLRETFEKATTVDAETVVTPRLDQQTHRTGNDNKTRSSASRIATTSRIIWSAFALLLLAAVAVYVWPALHSNRRSTSRVIDSLAVLPLVNATGDVAKDYLSDGITESLINSLAELNLKVISRNTVFKYKAQDIDAQAVARQLGVRGILTGNVRQVDDELLINIEFIDALDGSVVLSHQYVRKVSDLLAMQSSIAQDVASKLQVKLSASDQEHLAKWPTTSPEAYQLFLRATSYTNRATPDALHEAIKLFQQAVDLDPKYALAFSQMAQAYLLLGIYFERPQEMMPNARLYCEKALQLDSSLTDAHVTMGMINLIYDWDFDRARRELWTSEGMNPKAIETFSCSAHIMEATGRGDDAEREIRRALALDPLSIPLNTELGCNSYYERQFDSAIRENQEVLQLDPANPLAYWGLARALGQKQMYQQALDEIKKVQNSGGPVAPLLVAESGYAYAASGKKKEALETLKKLQDLEKQVFVDPYLIASIYAGLGEKEKALDYLEKALEMRSSFATSMNSEPKFDALRSDPRFVSMLQRVGFKG